MTNGTSQGLYVIIAVVIFGIFVGISYLIFQDSLKPKLMSIFETSFNDLNIVKKGILTDYRRYYSFIKQENDYISIEYSNETPNGWGGTMPVGVVTDKHKFFVDWNEKITWNMEVFVPEESVFIVDYNSYVKEGEPEIEGIPSYDAYGTVDFSEGFYGGKKIPLEKGKWNKVSFYTINNNPKNVNKSTIWDNPYFGVQQRDMDKITSYKIRNMTYTISKDLLKGES